MRARMAILLCGKVVRLREIILRDKPKDMLKASPKGTVPVLVLPNGEVIDESLSVMAWAIGDGFANLASPSNDERALVERNDGPFKHDLDRYKYPNRYQDVDALSHRAAGADFISLLNDRIKKTGGLSSSESIFGDIAIFPFIRQFRIADPTWFDANTWPDVHAWLERHINSDLFVRAMKKYPLWNDTGEEFIFGADEN